MTMTAGSTAGGAVYDRGYRPYIGQVGGRRAARWALFRLTARRALGIRRSWRQKVLPWALLAAATVPAIVNVGIMFATRDQPIDEIEIQFISFRDYIEVSSLLLLFMAVTAPDAICPDRHDRVLPLIFSRPLTGVDYVVSKVAALAALIFGFGFFPQVVLFVGRTIINEDGSLDYIGENAEVMWQVPTALAVMAVLYAAVSVALSSLTDRRIVGGIAIFGLTLVTTTVAAVLVFPGDGSSEDRSGGSGGVERVERVDPGRPGGQGSSDIEPAIPSDPAEPVAPVDPSEQGFPQQDQQDQDYLEDYEQQQDQQDYEQQQDYGEEDGFYEDGSPFALISVFDTPLYLRDVIFLGHVDPESQLGGVEGGAMMALLVYLVLLVLSFAVLFLRYREVKL